MLGSGYRKRLLFREVNERIREINATFGVVTGTSDVLCECEGVECVRRVEIPVQVYEGVRSERGQFVVAPPHHDPGGERVVAGAASYLVVAPSAVLAEAAVGTATA